MYQGRSVPRSRASRCHHDNACPVNRATSTARAARCRPPPRNAWSSRPSHRARSEPSSDSDQWRSCSRRCGSNGGSRNSPSARARMYNPVPPTTIGWRPPERASAIQPSASRANRPALYRSPGATRSRPRCGTRARVSGSGFAVPISSPRYTWRASAEITVMGVRAASATATAVLPTPVGPTMTGVWGRSVISHAKACARQTLSLRTLLCRAHPLGWGSPETPFQLFFWQLDHGGAAVDVVRRQRCREEPHDQLAHLPRVERLSRLDRGSTRVGRSEALQPILPAPESPAGEIGDELLQAACGLEARMRVRGRVNDDAAAGERLDLVADARQQLPMRVDRIELGGREVERERQQETLRGRSVPRQLTHHVLVQHPLVGGMLVDDADGLAGLKHDVGIEELEKSGARGLGVGA